MFVQCSTNVLLSGVLYVCVFIYSMYMLYNASTYSHSLPLHTPLQSASILPSQDPACGSVWPRRRCF